MAAEKELSKMIRLWVAFTSLGLLVTAILLLDITPNAFAEPQTGLAAPVTLGFFGLQFPPDSPWPTVPFGSWRLTIGWNRTETERGVWDFKKGDQAVDAATQHGVTLLIDLGFTPTWASATPEVECKVGKGMCAEPRNMEDWRNWLRTIGTRYKGRVRFYEVWNEPNDRSTFYTGSISGLVALTKAAREVLKSVDPNIQIVSPAPTHPEGGVRTLDAFLAAGGGAYVDIIGYHFYVHPGPPEGVFRYVQQIRGLMKKYGIGDKPLWDTEIGWVAPRLDDQTQAAYIARTLLLERGAGIYHVFWYGWCCRNELSLHLMEADRRTPTTAGRALKTVEDWMIGASVNSCNSSDEPRPKGSSHSMWICELGRDGTHNFAVWNPDGDKKFKVPKDWHVSQMHDLSGRTSSIPDNREITIGIQPVLLDSSR